MTNTEDGWDWAFSSRVEEQFSDLNGDTQERIVSKLDEIVSSEWREPDDYLEPLTDSPFQKLRIGSYRLGCRLVRE